MSREIQARRQLTTLDDIVTEAVGSSRFTTTLISAFAALALLLGALGLYGVLAHTVNLRTNEIGIRLALGAEPRGVLGMVVWNGITLVLVRVAIGLVVTFALRGAVESMLYGVEPLDPLSLAVALGTLLTISLRRAVFPRGARHECLRSRRCARISRPTRTCQTAHGG